MPSSKTDLFLAVGALILFAAVLTLQVLELMFYRG